jgi:hypothetical protein
VKNAEDSFVTYKVLENIVLTAIVQSGKKFVGAGPRGSAVLGKLKKVDDAIIQSLSLKTLTVFLNFQFSSF